MPKRILTDDQKNIIEQMLKDGASRREAAAAAGLSLKVIQNYMIRSGRIKHRCGQAAEQKIISLYLDRRENIESIAEIMNMHPQTIKSILESNGLDLFQIYNSRRHRKKRLNPNAAAIMRLAASGLDFHQIAKRLRMIPQTVRTIYHKINSGYYDEIINNQ